MESRKQDIGQYSNASVRNIRQALCAATLGLLLFLATGCEKKEPSVDQKFVDAYVEILAAENVYGKNSVNTMVKRQQILKEFGYDRDTFLKKANKILEDKDMWVPFQKAVVARIDTLIERNNLERRVRHQKGDD